MADQDISKRIFVKGFSQETTESELRALFEGYGVVRESKIVRDKHGVSKGYAFITFESQEVADELRDNELDFKDRQLSIGKAIRRKSSRYYSRHYYHHWQPPHRQEMVHDGGARNYYSSSMDGNVYYPVQQPQVVLIAPPSYSQQVSYPSQNLYQPHPHSSTQQLYSPTTMGMVGGSYVTAATTLPMQWNDYTTFNRVRQISSNQENSPEMTVGNSQIVSLAIADGNYMAEGAAGELPTQLVALDPTKIKTVGDNKPISVRFLKQDQ